MSEKNRCRPMQNFRFYLRLSIFSTLFGVLALASMWYQADKAFQPTELQLTSVSMARDNQNDKLTLAGNDNVPKCAQVATGVYLQSLNVHSTNDIHISGYIWQKVPIAPDCPLQAKAGFNFPEAVEGASEFRKENETIQDNQILHRWYFAATLRQTFDYSKYPLDHQTVSLRILSSDVDGQSILIPDLAAYPDTSMNSYLGLDSDIVLADWLIEETFFDFKTTTYHTNFGYQAVAAEKIPELHFNVALKRKFKNALMINLIPVFTVAILLFTALPTIGRERNTPTFQDFSIKAVIGTMSALLLVVVLLHANIRAKFPAQSIVYIEYFYLLLYTALILVALCSFVFFTPANLQHNLVRHNFMLAKLIYWPSLILAMVIVSYWVLF